MASFGGEYAKTQFALPKAYRQLLCTALESKDPRPDCTPNQLKYSDVKQNLEGVPGYGDDDRVESLKKGLGATDDGYAPPPAPDNNPSPPADPRFVGQSCSKQRAALLKEQYSGELAPNEMIEAAVNFCIGVRKAADNKFTSTNAKVLLALWERGDNTYDPCETLAEGAGDYNPGGEEPNAGYVMWFLLQIPDWKAPASELFDTTTGSNTNSFLAIARGAGAFKQEAFKASIEALTQCGPQRAKQWAEFIDDGELSQASDIVGGSAYADPKTTTAAQWQRMCDCLACGVHPIDSKDDQEALVAWRGNP